MEEVLSILVFHFDLKDLFYFGLTLFQPYGIPSFDYLVAASIVAVVMPWVLYFHSERIQGKGRTGSDERRADRDVTWSHSFGRYHLSSAGSFVSVSELSKALSIF